MCVCVCVLQFTVTPVRQSSVNSPAGSGRKHLAVFEIGDDAEATDTLTQNSITSLLSAKFRVSHALLASFASMLIAWWIYTELFCFFKVVPSLKCFYWLIY